MHKIKTECGNPLTKLIPKCRLANIPLFGATCVCDRSYLNQAMNKWYLQNLQQQELADIAALERKTVEVEAEKQHRTVRYLDEILAVIQKPVETPYKYPGYVSRGHYKRISPEYLEILDNFDASILPGPSAKDESKWTEPITADEGHKPEPQKYSAVEYMNPTLAGYMHNFMEKEDLTKRMYSIDYYCNFKEKDKDVNFMDPTRLSYLLGILRTGSYLLDEQMVYLMRFLQSAVNANEYEVKSLLLPLAMRGILNEQSIGYLRNLLSQISKTMEHGQSKIKPLETNLKWVESQLEKKKLELREGKKQEVTDRHIHYA